MSALFPPRCRTFLITEPGLAYTYSSDDNEGGRTLPVAEIGIMRNRSGRSALGITGYLTATENVDYQGGIKLRYRRWLRGEKSVDIAAKTRAPSPSGTPV